MLNFKEWLLSEVLDSDSEVIELKRQSNGRLATWSHSFKLYNKQYLIIFDETYAHFHNTEIDNVWIVAFNANNSYELTRNSSTNDALFVYNKVISSLRALFKKVNPNGIKFSPAQPEMKLMYDRFVKKYLTNFTLINENQNWVNDETYIKTEIVQKIIANLPPSDQTIANDKLNLLHTAGKDAVQRAKNLKLNQRAARVAQTGWTDPNGGWDSI